MIRIITSVTLASGGIAAAASLAMGVAVATPDASDVSVPDPFGITFAGDPNFSYQMSDAVEGIAYGHQAVNFDSAAFAPSVEQFFTNNVTVDGQPLNLSTNPLTDPGVQATIIDKVEYNGNTEQQILLPSIAGTNIDHGFIDIHDFGGGNEYAIIDLVGPGETHLNSNGIHDAVGAFVITPTATYDVSPWENGGDFGNYAYLESQLFDLSGATSASVPDPFGVTLVGDPDITYQTGDVFVNHIYGSQQFDFDSSNFAPYVDKFFTSNVTVDGQPLALADNPLTADGLQANVVDVVQFDNLFNGLSEQQILLPSIAGTNIDHGVIDIENFGNGFGYESIDLVGPGTTHLASNGVDDAIGAWLVTPMGTYDVSPLADLEAQMFDPSNFDPSAFFPDAALTPLPFFFLY
jgi:putative intracellular protease/amidase